MGKKQSAVILVLTFFTIGLYQNCAKQKFGVIDPEMKAGVLSSASVFSDSSGTNVVVDATGRQVASENGNGSLGVNADGKKDGSSVGVTQTPALQSTVVASVIADGQVSLPIKYMCSRAYSDINGFNVMNTLSITVHLQSLQPGRNGCSYQDSSVLQKIINEKKIVLANLNTKCPGLVDGDYQLRLTKSNLDGDLLSVNDPKMFKVTVATVAGAKNYTFSEAMAVRYGNIESYGPMHVLYDSNGEEHREAATAGGQVDVCDRRASPLVVQLKSDVRKPSSISLSSPLEGIQFDILGKNSNPAPHVKKQISWFMSNSSEENYFIALPKNGEVKGVDELFGDNTYGPDRKFAANGYEALRKYDGKLASGKFDRQLRDGYITKEDPIYADLKLWADHNRDGVSQPQELYSLQEKGIEIIDLNYDPNFVETDKYGNETKMKSVVKTEDGQLHLLYDIWFRYL